LVVYATAIVLCLPQEKQAALKNYDHRVINVPPGLKPAPLLFYSLSGSDRFTPFPSWYVERLEKMAEFTMHVTKPDGHIPQVGDNDNGRFLKLQPVYHRVSVADVKARYANLEEYNELPDDSLYWDEDHLDHHHLVAAINGFFRRDDFAIFTGDGWMETDLVGHLAGDVRLPSYRQPGGPTAAEGIRIEAHKNGVQPSTGSRGQQQVLEAPAQDVDLLDDLRCYAYPDFGLYLYRSNRLYVAVRCGPIGQNGNGGHAHNDSLSFELAVDGIPVIADPGTYLYTPLPKKRNLFRSTAMHNTLSVPGKEQNLWYRGTYWLFRMIGQANATVQEFHERRFAGRHTGFGSVHRRTIEVFDGSLLGRDTCKERGEKRLFFHLAPTVQVRLLEGSDTVDVITTQGVSIRLQSGADRWIVEEGEYSPAYGVVQRSQMLRLSGSVERMEWIVHVEAKTSV
ncbi:MAG: alginate lyase family protein, partial [Candidatus Latescibacteria bacterium]|nr:alginate lyase family protein [Candidatus Latescibacterota bacterium]